LMTVRGRCLQRCRTTALQSLRCSHRCRFSLYVFLLRSVSFSFSCKLDDVVVFTF